MDPSQQKCSVIRVDKKTSLLVYRPADCPDSILQNNNENASTHKVPFSAQLKAIFTPSTSSFSADAAAQKRDAEQSRILGRKGSSPLPPVKRNEIVDTASVNSTSSKDTNQSDCPKSPKVCFAPPPVPDRPRGRSASISCGVASRAAMLRGEIPEPTHQQTATQHDLAAEPYPTNVPNSAVEDDEPEESPGRSICRNATYSGMPSAKEVASPTSAPPPASNTPAPNLSRRDSASKSIFKNPFGRRSSATSINGTAPERSLSPHDRKAPKDSNVIYEYVSHAEADRVMSKQSAESNPRIKNGTLKVCQEEDEWVEHVQPMEGAR